MAPQQQAPEKADELKADYADLMIGAGVAAAGGISAHKHEEKDPVEDFYRQSWYRDAEARRLQYNRSGLVSPAVWVLSEPDAIPRDVLAIRQEEPWTLYIARVYYKGGLQFGKTSHEFTGRRGAVIGYANKEIDVFYYETLVGDMRGLHWVDAKGKLDVNALGYKPVEGGRGSDDAVLYVAQAHFNGATHPGKCSSSLNGAVIVYDGSEKELEEYKVLCYT